MDNIIIATIKEWNIKNYFNLIKQYEGTFTFHLITNPEELTTDLIERIKPKYLFFPHWSWIIPKEIHTRQTCIVFHMTDLPYGRGGSPLQNLIINQVYQTKISALKVTHTLDAGDIYLKEDLDISKGSAEENYIKASNIIFHTMIPKILTTNITPLAQSGKVTTFKRRNPKQSNILAISDTSLPKLYDFIRMLDATDYPKAYLELENIRIEFSKVCSTGQTLIGQFKVLENE